MIEMFISVAAAVAVFVVVLMRLNTLHAAGAHITFWRAAEVIGLAILLAGCAGVIGEWFLENAEFHAETVVMVGAAIAGMGMSRGELCAFIAKVQSWDALDRRPRNEAAVADAFIEQRFGRER